MNLVIVESPTKAKTISQFLGKDFKVESSYGHIRDLPKSQFGIDLENGFTPKYVIPTKARKVVSMLKKAVTKSDKVILATDEDREGEAIAWHLTEALGLGSQKLDVRSQKRKIQPPTSNIQSLKVERIVFHEITKNAIKEALKHPRSIDQNMVNAQQGRRVLDRLVGYKLSPFLWKKITGGLSAGRVQSVALRLIADREQEIRSFKPQEYWTITALLQKNNNNGQAIVETHLFKIDGNTLEKLGIQSQKEAEQIVSNLQGCSYKIAKLEKKEAKKNPPPPFTTSTLQQEAAKRLHYSSKKTMFLAQHLYENGFITYMRTDSLNLSAESTSAAKQWLEKNLGTAYSSEAPRQFKAKSKLAQEAHEAVRPTNAGLAPEQISLADNSEKHLYQLIWQRFMASQMPQARVALTIVEITASNQEKPGPIYILRASGQQIVFDGFLKIWHQKLEEKEIPDLKENESLDLKEVKPEQHFTEAPPRYSEASLIKTLEEYGIGRPSTYAPIISVIQFRNYVKKEAGRFQPTEIGEMVNRVLTENFPEIVDVGFTAKMEDELDGIAEGRSNWHDVIKEFYEPFSKNLDIKYKEVSKQSLITETTDEKCEKCGRPMAIRMGRFGKFMACSGFPECKNAKKMPNASGEKTEPKKIGLKCPKCSEGDVVERRVNRGRARGKIFWGCSRYPDCDYATWNNPIAGEARPA